MSLRLSQRALPILRACPGTCRARESGVALDSLISGGLASGDIDSWEWDFDDDGTIDSTAENPSFTYAAAGAYTVSLTVSGLGGTATETRIDYVSVDAAAVPPPARLYRVGMGRLRDRPELLSSTRFRPC